MPKSKKSLNQFDKGILNKYDNRDIPEGGMSNLTDVLCDIPGQLRQMGSEISHSDAVLSDASIAGLVDPGYGLFTFDTDYSIATNQEIPTRVLAIQNINAITILDWTYRNTRTASELTNDPGLGIFTNEIYIYGDSLSTQMVRPIYDFIDGTLYISDGNFENTLSPETDIGSNYTKEYKYIRKFWFPTLGSAAQHSIPSTYNGSASINNVDSLTLGEWISFQSYVFPPSVSATGLNTHQLYSHTNLKRDVDAQFPGESNTSRANLTADLDDGNITISIAEHDTPNTGEWTSDDEYKFGISFQYDDNRESLITSFIHVMPVANDNVSLSFELYAKMTNTNHFDKRI